VVAALRNHGSMPDSSYRPSRADPLLIMAMDHRESFGKSLFEVRDDQPDAEQLTAMEQAKRLIYAGLARARAQLPGGRAGVLVDERYGQAVIDQAHADGVVLATPIEHSGREWFELEWGQDWVEHLTAARASFAKILIRDNPAFARDRRDRQLADLRQVSDRLHGLGVPLLYELLVPATPEQLATAGGDTDTYDRDLRPELVTQVIADNQAAGVEPAIWKIEGLETAAAAQLVVAQIRAGGRDDIDAIVLGRDAPVERLNHWLAVAAPVDGFVGFAIGRSIWEDAIAGWRRGDAGEAETEGRIAARYLEFARTYCAAGGARGAAAAQG
jgi:myo-inositol catabolism protein IolC